VTDHDRALVGKPGSRWHLPTPSLVLDLDALESNVARMAEHARNSGIALRPHTKTHKSADIARLQIRAGAIGVCCAKVSEAEVMAAGGLQSILITSPIVAEPAIERLVALAANVGDLIAVADSPACVDHIAAEAERAGVRIALLVDVDVGTNRTGVTRAEAAVSLAARIAGYDSLIYAGLQAYAGHVMHLERYEGRREASLDALARLAAIRDAVSATGLQPKIVSGGGTGTFDIDPAVRLLTELQAGSYVFMDREYEDIEYREGVPPFARSLFVHTTVISANHAGFCTTDAGFKAFATDGPKPVIHSGAPEGSSYVFMGDEHGAVLLPGGAEMLPLGALVVCTPPHCDPTVNLYDRYYCVRGDALVDIWPVSARGCSV
jgi:D-serine deaminase-like pyridoxal phosphate-dependent protein